MDIGQKIGIKKAPSWVLKWWAVQDLPSGKTSDEVFLQAGLAVLALLRKQKHRSAFQILPRIKQFMRY